ncbi:MGMT family protein [Corynebacterium alimapuense]|uniref:Cysteine methyltransferase n=1 Tax=Corynebacterium alimapuense TaxID=1576874 RepID=A0A3M8K4S0_9CORY|nr:MGMT family protein [Corynebacterium alimapuense]RNE48201.1 cysteine methyltransferase [Corynebacterium alimapuense]
MSSDPVFELDDLTSAVLALVDALPPGQVTTYGALAAEVGTGPRQVGRIMANYGHLTAWWRVVRADGSSHDPERSVPHWDVEGIAHNGRAVKL